MPLKIGASSSVPALRTDDLHGSYYLSSVIP